MIIVRHVWVLILICVGGIRGLAQTAEPFESLSIDRPDVSNLPNTIRPGHFQFEVGSERVLGNYLSELHIPNVMFRTGLSKRSELRIGYDLFLLDSLGNGQKDGVMLGTIGGKYRFVEASGRRPSVALQAEFGIPFGSGTLFGYDHTDFSLAAYSLLLLFNNNLHERVFLNYNAGVFWSRSGGMDYLLSASTSFMHTHRLSYFLELYTPVLGTLPVSFDGGVLFLVSPRFQIDAYGGQRALGDERFWFYGAGFGVRGDRGDLKRKTFKGVGIHH